MTLDSLLGTELLQRSRLHGSFSTGLISFGGLKSLRVAGGVSILSESISILSLILSSSECFLLNLDSLLVTELCEVVEGCLK